MYLHADVQSLCTENNNNNTQYTVYIYIYIYIIAWHSFMAKDFLLFSKHILL